MSEALEKLARISDVDAAWAAGLYEGEGSITGQPGRHIVLKIVMTDCDVVERFGQVVGVGCVRHVRPQKTGRKDLWAYRCYTAAHVEALCDVLMPYLGQRRRAQIERVLAGAPTRPAQALRTHCPQGHPYKGANVIWWKNHRQCRACKNAHARRAYAESRVAA